MIENIFTNEGILGHEIVFVYRASFVEASFYEQESFKDYEDNGVPFNLFWKPIRDFKTRHIKVSN
ncbi:hypothetical protein [Geomicrobium sp. JCM 19038]|uniref:hypothetical protein n=1 Tax=Geomicrobium sp. JCM 19038 TaxID=1460635 RepID=UPI00045F1107|nr:hypothetical protein [Geomicrobium sp. JCM 19038]GAK08110.1 MutT/Nudix family protein [Geomicrobium sp. JCM 19038]